MPEHHRPRFVGCFALDPIRKHFPYATQPMVAKSIRVIINRHHSAVLGIGALRHDDHRIARSPRWTMREMRIAKTRSQKLKDFFVAEWMFGYQNQVSLTCYS